MQKNLNEEKLMQIKNKIESVRQNYVSEMENAFNSAISDIFNDNPDVNIIAWRQFAPYFNDGDPCVFGVESPIVASLKYDLVEKIGIEQIIEGSYDSFSSLEEYEECEELGQFEYYDYSYLGHILNSVIVYLEDKFGDCIVIMRRDQEPVTEDFDHD